MNYVLRMAPRSQHQPIRSDEEFNLVSAFQACLSPSIIVINQHEKVLSCAVEDCEPFHQFATTGATLAALPAPLVELARKALATKSPLTQPTLTLHFVGWPDRQFHVTALPASLSPEESIVILSLTDITRLVRWQQSLAQLDRLATAGTLAAGMAHEIKNALVAVKTFTDLLIEKNKDAELAELVGRELSRINAIVRQLLRSGSPAAPERTPVRLHDVLEHSLRMVQHQLSDKLICLNRAFAATSDTVQGNNHQLEQVFVNLLLNAVEATGANGSLTVQTEFISAAPPGITSPQLVGQPHVRVIVTDTGIGIAPENMAQMFELFFTTKSHGTGLGLPITQRIVQEHHGLITVESQINKGTTFSVILPAGQPVAPRP